MSKRKIPKLVGGIAGATALGATILYLYQEEEKVPEKVEEEPVEIELKEEEPEPIKKRTISDFLKDEPNVALLDEKDSVGLWKGAWDQYLYKSSQTEVSSVWKGLNSVDIRSAQAPNSYKQMCKTNSSQEIESTEDKLYQEVKTFCTKDKPREQK